MSTPMSGAKFVSALRAEGLNVKEHAGWLTHNRAGHGGWGPMNGVVIHHTAGRDSLARCYSGDDALPGPLCHTHLSKTGVATMVGNGRANHAGSFAQNAHNAVVNESATHPAPSSAEPVDGNAHYYGLEIENLGNGTDHYPQAQYDAAVCWAAAICRAHGWGADSVIGHKEGTTRKIDPKGPVGSASGSSFSMKTFRADVAAKLMVTPTPPVTVPVQPPVTPPKAKPVVDLSNAQDAAQRDPKAAQGKTSHPADVKLIEAALKAEGLLASEYASDGAYGRLTVEAYRRYQVRLGFNGSNADGIPGRKSLTRLGNAHGFTVKS